MDFLTQKSKLFIEVFSFAGFLFFMTSFGGLKAQNLLINEVLASNSNVDYDDFFQYEDWIEIYNAGGIQNLAGFYLSDDPDTLDKWMFPSTNAGLTTILPGGHLRVWCDNDEGQGEDHTNFKISSESETLFLVAMDGQTILDSISTGLQQTDISYGRTCDGCVDWQFFNVPTPDAPNSMVPIPTAALFINEYQPGNSSTVFDEWFSFSAWVEIFNPNDFQVNLAGYSLSSANGSHTFLNSAPWLTTIDANSHQIFWLDGAPSLGANHLDLLPNGNGQLTLEGADGTPVDAIDWNESLLTDHSFGRISDGATVWTEFTTPTPRITNSLQIILPEPIVINEIQSDNFITYPDNVGEYEDWIELFNPTNSAVNLAGYFLSDRLDQPMKWQFPVGIGDSTIIQPGGYMMLFADENGSEGWNHINFKLSSLGEPLALRSPDGFTVADSLFIPELSPDRSWGRAYDAGTPWIVFNIPTPNASNGPVSMPETLNMQNSKLVVFPNPATAGRLVFAGGTGTLYNVQGEAVSQWNQAGWQEAPATPGLYIFINAVTKHSRKLIVVN